ncbi:MAG: NDP-sugar synthase [Actinomycetota bacterium]|nr:NDP-sugar synthase [Actinomycetota bacterium]
MKAVLLVGGQGTRLRPLTLDTPKQMLPVALETMLERVLRPFADAGVEEVVLSLGYRPEAFEKAFPDSSACGIKLRYVVEPEPLGTAGAIGFAAREADLGEGSFLVHNGDVVTDIDLGELERVHRATGAEATIALASVEDPSAFGVVVTGPGGRVEDFVEKPAPGTAPSNLVNAGTYLMEPAVLARIPVGSPCSVERDVFPAIAAEGRMFAVRASRYWLDAGTPEKYVRANLDVLRLSGDRPPVEGATPLGGSAGAWVVGRADFAGSLSGHVLVGAGSVVAAGSSVGDSVLGTGTTVAAGAEVQESVVMDGAVVAEGAVVVQSVVGPSAVVGAGARVTDGSVVGFAAVVADGSRLSGVRLAATGREMVP